MARKRTNNTLVFLILALFSSSLITSSTGQCETYSFPANVEAFTNCQKLPVLNSFLHWTYTASSGTLRMAYRHTGVADSTWVAWGINPASAAPAMPGAFTLYAAVSSGAISSVNMTTLAGYRIPELLPGSVRYPVADLSATYTNREVTIFATWTLPISAGAGSINQVWQAGPVSGDSLRSHSISNAANVNSRGVLDLSSGQTQSVAGSGATLKKKNTHGVLNAVSWGILMPIGAVTARYLKVFQSADPAWFYLHVTCQTVAYVVGVAGWGTGLKLGSESPGITHNPHRSIGIALFCLGTLQVFALLLRPKKDHKLRIYWSAYHHMVGYAVIALSIANIFEGFEILQPEKIWKRAYTGVIIAIGAVALVLECYTWFYVIKKKKNENKTGFGGGAANGANGYGSSSRTHNEV